VDITPAMAGLMVAMFLLGFAAGALVKRRLPARG
jgi:hypothetical protein